MRRTKQQYYEPQIKFRAWDKKHKVMIVSERIGSIDVVLGDPKHFIPMQFTGLHDKNRKEIYEGDIIADDRIDRVKGFIEFDRGAFCIHRRDGDPQKNAGNHIRHFYQSHSVIGNIYENPELLK